MRWSAVIGFALFGLLVVAAVSACSTGNATDGGSDSAPSQEQSQEQSAATNSAETDPTSTDGEVVTDRIPFTPESPIKVDQFGYRPGDPKWAVLADPERGYNSELDYEPGTEIEVRRVADNTVAFTAEPIPWNDGAVHDQSGDRGWWLDFSDLRQSGAYYLVDPEAGVAGPDFVIADDVYDAVFTTAFRVFWFNRGNTVHPESLGGPWHDEAAFVGQGQDTEARAVDDPDNPDTARDLSGGWFDAGDTNKYITFAGEPVHVLLTAYERVPNVFDDNDRIPESGNGTPDVLDEILWELDWFERMQNDDGGVLTKVGVVELEGSKLPSTSRLPRFYEEACSSATITAAGVFAHAALVLRSVPGLEARADHFQQRALRAWDWYGENPQRNDCDPQIIWAGDADLSFEDQAREEVVAAVYLFALTGDEVYQETIRDGYNRTTPFSGAGFGLYGLDQADALMFYTEQGDADPDVVAAIETLMAERLAQSPLLGPSGADLYRSHLPDSAYHWGSNMVMANAGTANLLVDPQDEGAYRALSHLHYFHGVNPLGLTYLSNMKSVGADHSVQQLFHSWFGDGSPYDISNGSDVGTAPGYLVGGPNSFYSGSDNPPAGQPAQKSYRDWAADGSQPTWETTEPAIYYQAAYVRLLAEILGRDG